jgi:hypothetical protein
VEKPPSLEPGNYSEWKYSKGFPGGKTSAASLESTDAQIVLSSIMKLLPHFI